jgi:phage terminase small subunit
MARERLLPQQELFIKHYLACNIATVAARKAGYNPDYSTQLLRNSAIKRHLASARLRLAEKFEATTERIVLELARISYLDPAELFDENGKLKPIHEIPPEVRAAISSIQVTTNQEGETVTKLKLWDKTKTLEMLSKYRKLYSDAPQTINLYRDEPTEVLEAKLAALINEYVIPLLQPPEASQQVIDVTNTDTYTDPNDRQPVSSTEPTDEAATSTISTSKEIKSKDRRPRTD